MAYGLPGEDDAVSNKKRVMRVQHDGPLNVDLFTGAEERDGKSFACGDWVGVGIRCGFGIVDLFPAVGYEDSFGVEEEELVDLEAELKGEE